ncbi:ABC transporter [Legionella quinlivanii]|uniref:ABC transporter n=1 Tax=Legionella quinlivanii TaxID=45073 RepID=A0A0W0Y5X6_9GAMM|nr:ATP-binding cassette domain-containing protein [Legionella quinlivanii]KTD51923.1 ABC transporter [Legionella quinlivanii]SEF84947.1 NHLM bacteriocin system ABC transporter, ATP-binding protein [Legionella quinlivanii DSM 21216]STY09614.1 ABC transporter [Legionella quinlivanii]
MNQDEDLPLSSLHLLEDIYNEKETPLHSDNILESYFAVCSMITRHLGMEIHKPVLQSIEHPDPVDYLNSVATANSLRIRKIRLKRNWWHNDLGPMAVFYKKKLCALIPQGTGYQLIDCQTGKQFRITPSNQQNVKADAYIFYPTLPQESIPLKDILKFTFKVLKKDQAKVIIFQILISLSLLVVPVMTGVIFDDIIPFANLSLLGQALVLLLLTNVITQLLYLLQVESIIRLQIKSKHRLQVAIMDRLLRLPLSFFNQYTAGELSFRAGIINEVQEILSANILRSMLDGLMSLVNFFLMFYINSMLSLAAVSIVLVITVASLIFNRIILRQERKVIEAESTLSGILLSIINAIIKLRIAHKEDAAFASWNKCYSDKMREENKTHIYQNRLDIFNIFLTGMSTLTIYSLVIWQNAGISFGQFIVFNAAFVQFFSAFVSLSNVVSESLEIIPLFKMAKPIFATETEKEENKSPVDLDGHIVLKDVVFRYPDQEEPIFVDFNLEVQPGSFTAIVGPSGSGKSTLFRLLLGLENIESGEIKFSGIDLKNIHLRNLRSQMGVVMQVTRLIPGTIFENFAGNNDSLTRREAWDIARATGLEELIQDLPMGMDTLINDGIQTFSGGEVQRINLARAISANPKILLLDEATSALDNKVQKQINETLEAMNLTRLVIAHRFSTIVNADIIHVIRNGRCIESGTYEELIRQKGFFYQMAKHQL